MIIGTTPIHTIKAPYDIIPIIKTIKVTYKQDDKIILVKRTEDCVIEKNKISIQLTQEDTFNFEPNKIVKIQWRILTTGRDVIGTDVIIKKVTECLDDEVLV